MKNTTINDLWKGVRKNIFKGILDIELYDFDKDLQEVNNLASIHPEIVAYIANIMKEQKVSSPIERFNMEQIEN